MGTLTRHLFGFILVSNLRPRRREGGGMVRAIVLLTITLIRVVSPATGDGAALAQADCGAQKAQRSTPQERIVQRDIQEAIDQEIEELGAKDLDAVSRRTPQDFTIR